MKNPPPDHLNPKVLLVLALVTTFAWGCAAEDDGVSFETCDSACVKTREHCESLTDRWDDCAEIESACFDAMIFACPTEQTVSVEECQQACHTSIPNSCQFVFPDFEGCDEFTNVCEAVCEWES